MTHPSNDDDLIINDNDCSFFDFCQEKQLIIEVTINKDNQFHKLEGYLTGFERRKSLLTIRGMQGNELTIPLNIVVLLTVKGRS